MKITEEEKEIQNAIQFIKSQELGTKISPLWEEMSKDFSFDKKSSLRDYSINTEYDQEKIRKFYKHLKRVGILFLFFKKIINRTHSYLLGIENIIQGFISKLVLGNFRAAKKFSFHIYPMDTYEKHQKKSGLLKEFEGYNKKYRVFFSHNNYKSFSYFFDLKKYINLKEENIKSILEIGSGLFNFGTILTRNLDSFNYFCIDLPDVALRGWVSARNNVDSDIEVYLPHQMDQFINSSCAKKIIFLIPSQLEDINKSIDLFVNHESFSEMYISTVNDYLNKANKIMQTNSLMFLVNRFSRAQSSNNYTNFDDYELDAFSTIYKSIEEFRSFIPVQKEFPNIFYIGRKK